MEVSRSRYYQFESRNKVPLSPFKALLIHEMKTIAAVAKNSYGSRRMSKKLKSKGYSIGRHAARTLMQAAGVRCKQRRRFRVTTDSSHSLIIAENKLARQFNVSAPNKVWVADITYLWTLAGWIYVAGVLDLFSKRIVGWAIADHMRSELIESAMEMALGRRRPLASLMHHSDRGVQYACGSYQSLLEKNGIVVSMSRKGNCWDNAVMERFWGSLKSERTDNETYLTKESAKNDVIDYIEMFYNSERLHSALGYVSPNEFENQYLSKNVSTFT